MAQESKIFTPEIEKVIYSCYVVDNMTLKDIAKKLDIKLGTMYKYASRKDLAGQKANFLNKVSVRVVENSTRTMIKAFTNSIESSEALISHFNDKIKKHRAEGTLDHMIKTMDPKEFQILKLAIELNNKHVATRTALEQFKQNTSNGSSGTTEVVFSDGYVPEMLDDDRFKVEDAVQLIEELDKDNLQIDVTADMLTNNNEEIEQELDGQDQD